ncbi:MAG: hypothetical protein JXO51_05120 [Candidatus Aminicenantes bacterium]|nr:hypothetical protein [Candidatus Aminicenantes bacterium]
MNELFSVHSLVRGFTYEGTTYEEVKVTWFVAGRQAPLAPYAEAIQDYGQLDENDRVFPEEYLDEQFSREEAEALKKYLDRRPEVSTEIQAVDLPVMGNASGCRRLLRGGGNDFIGLFKEKGYPLPFQVQGYFSVRLAEPRVLGDDRQTVAVRRPQSSDK